MNAFTTIVNQWISVGVKMDEEDLCMTLLCYLSDSWDNLVMTIGRIVKTLVLDESVVALLLGEVRWKTFESTNDVLVVRGRLKEKGKKKENGISKSHGRHTFLQKSKVTCWNCSKVEHFQKGMQGREEED
jgi:hypothetical protein